MEEEFNLDTLWDSSAVSMQDAHLQRCCARRNVCATHGRVHVWSLHLEQVLDHDRHHGSSDGRAVLQTAAMHFTLLYSHYHCIIVCRTLRCCVCPCQVKCSVHNRRKLLAYAYIAAERRPPGARIYLQKPDVHALIHHKIVAQQLP